MVKNHFHLALDKGRRVRLEERPESPSRSHFRRKGTGKSGNLRATGILLIGVVVSMGEKNAAVQLLCTVSPPRKGAEAKRVWCV